MDSVQHIARLPYTEKISIASCPENWSALIDDLRERTGLPISRVEIGRINFLRDTAELKIYYNARLLNHSLVSVAENDTTFSPED